MRAIFSLLTNKPKPSSPATWPRADLANLVALVEGANENEGAQPAQAVELTPAAKFVKAVQDYARAHFATEAVVISAQIESELVDLSPEEAAE